MNWFSILSICLNVVLLLAGTALFIVNWKADKKNKSQVKIWMEQANGLQLSLNRIVQDKWAGLYSSVNDVVNAVWAAHAAAFSLYLSLYEERVLKEEDYIKEQMEQRKYLKKQLRKSTTQKGKASTPTSP